MSQRPKAYRVVQWKQVHESSETRKVGGTLTWVKKPNKHDGFGFRYLAAQENKVELYCAWCLMLEIASRGSADETRGWIARNGQPLSASGLAVMTGFPEGIFQKAFEFFRRPEIGWLQEDYLSAPSPEASGDRPGVSGQHPGKTAPSPEASGTSPDRERYREIQRETDREKGKKKGGAGSGAGDGVKASVVQFAATNAQVNELEERRRNGELDEEGKARLRLLKKKRAEVQSRQAAGDFETPPVVAAPAGADIKKSAGGSNV